MALNQVNKQRFYIANKKDSWKCLLFSKTGSHKLWLRIVKLIKLNILVWNFCYKNKIQKCLSMTNLHAFAWCVRKKNIEKCNSLKIKFLQMNPVSLITWVWTIFMHRSQSCINSLLCEPFYRHEPQRIFSFEYSQ